MKNYFIPWLKEHFPKLFYLVLIFIAGQIFVLIIGVETFPFLNYGMYSQVKKPSETYEVYRIYANNIPVRLNEIPDLKRDFILSSIKRYQSLSENYDSIPDVQTVYSRAERLDHTAITEILTSKLIPSNENLRDFPIWLGRYLGKGEGFNAVKVDVETWRYRQGSEIELVNKRTLID